ncbi:hypothetical protein D3C76_1371500 [compost metagenome]
MLGDPMNQFLVLRRISFLHLVNGRLEFGIVVAVDTIFVKDGIQIRDALHLKCIELLASGRIQTANPVTDKLG